MLVRRDDRHGPKAARIHGVEYEVMLLAATCYDKPIVRTFEELDALGTAVR